MELSKIFKWYKQDFGDDAAETLLWLSQHCPESQRKYCGAVVNSDGFQIKYLDYDWKLAGNL